VDQSSSELWSFDIITEVGRGTTGIVYEARDRRLDRRVALKVLVIKADDQANANRTWFLRECQVTAFLTSPPGSGIPALHSVGEQDGKLFSVREFVDGDSLERLVVKGGLDIKAGLEIIVGVARTLQGVHERGIVHRNLSAANILVASDGTPWLIGFGRARRLTTEQPRRTTATDVRGLHVLLEWLYVSLDQSNPSALKKLQLLDPNTPFSLLVDAVGNHLTTMG
jgi:eukaryotic-like serine/threonine-protein kinase